MVAGPLPSGISRCSVLPSKRMRRSKAEAMLQAARAPVKISVAVACRDSRAESLTGVMAVAPSANRRALAASAPVGRKKVIGAGNEHQPFGFGGGGGNLLNCAAGANWSWSPLRKSLGRVQFCRKEYLIFAAFGLGGQAQRGEGADGWAAVRLPCRNRRGAPWPRQS
jgi:hypothetical protein